MRVAPWQRTVLGCVLLPLVVVFTAALVFYYAVVDTTFSTAVFHADTGLARESGERHPLVYEDRPGRVTIVVARGADPDKFMTGHGWREEVAIDMPLPITGDRIDLTRPDVRVALIAHNDHRVRWGIGNGGVHGFVDYESVSSNSLAARYNVVVDAETAQLTPGNRHRTLVFEGRATFRAQPRPTEERYGDLWPKP
jgi:hypothetical protein